MDDNSLTIEIIMITVTVILWIIKLKIKSKNNHRYRMKELRIKNSLDRENRLIDEKKNILLAWQNINNNSIKKLNGDDAEIKDRIGLFINKKEKVVDGKKIHYSDSLGELISQTLIYSFSVEVHNLIEMNMKIIYQNLMIDKDLKDENNCKSMAIASLIYFFLSLEWQGKEESEISKDLTLNLYIADYNFGKTDQIKEIKNQIQIIYEEVKIKN